MDQAEYEAKIQELEQAKQDAETKLAEFQKQVERDKKVQTVIQKTGVAEDAIKDFCDAALDGFAAGVAFARTQDAESGGAQSSQSSQSCPEGQRWDPQQDKCVNRIPAKQDTGDHAKKSDAQPAPKTKDATPPALVPVQPGPVDFKAGRVEFQPDGSRYLGEK